MSSAPWLEGIAVALFILNLGLPLLTALPLITMSLGLGSLCLRFTARGNVLRSLDASAAMVVTVVAFLVGTGLAVAGAVQGAPWPGMREAVVVVGGLTVARSCRVELEVGAQGEFCTRRILGVRWWRQHMRGAELFLDGWGDFSDPLALHLGDHETSLELGWFDASYPAGRPEAMVAELNAALARGRGSWGAP